MSIDNPEISHTSYDIEKNQTPVVQEVITQSQRWIEDIIDDTNWKLNWVKLELSKTKEKQEKEVIKLIQVNWLKKSFESGTFSEQEIYVKIIEKWVFSVVSIEWNVQYFVDEKWDIIFWIASIIERPFLKNWKALKYAWYIEKKEDWIYNMYKIEWWKEIWPIDINSPEYYNAWQDIIFYADFLNKTVSLKFNDPETKKWIEVLIEWWSFKFEDLELFKDEWLITQEIFDYWLQEMQKVIVAQCSDERLINMKLNKEQFRKKDWSLPKWLEKLSIWGVKESDLMKYYSKWYIDKDTAVECYKAMPSEMRDVTNKKD